MPQEQVIQMPVANKTIPNDRYCTSGMVMKLLILGIIFLAISLTGFIASTAQCYVSTQFDTYDMCRFEAKLLFGVGVGTVSAGAMFIFLALVGWCSRP